mmetsp:Transcript_18403/g.31471  ORF Transcript_18403/g.31471 Transcript_18403/m.31471 type:complete len:80 (+) Transcript_18403:735-974(+)
MFLGFLSGYMIGYYVMNLSYQSSLLMSVVVGTITIFVEAVLMILRLHRMEQGRQLRQKTEKENRTVMQLEMMRQLQRGD